MRLTVAHKLIVAFLGLTIVLLIVTLGLARWSFERGFLDYSVALEQERLGRLAERLKEEYQQSGRNWAWVDGRSFASLLSEMTPARRVGPGPAPPPPDFARARPPPPPPRGFSGPDAWRPHEREGPPPRPPGPTAATGESGRRSLQDLGRVDRPEPGAQHAPHRFPMGPPTALYAPDGVRIAGPALGEVRSESANGGRALDERGAAARDEILRIPIRLDGTDIGELRSRIPPRAFDTAQATAFSRQQLLTSLMIGVTGLVLALGLSILLARALLAPLRRAIGGVARLSDGDYGQRLNEARTDELGQLMTRVDQLAQVLESNRSTRRRWLADVSHELRTPVTILTGEIDALKDGLRPFDRKQLQSLDQEVARIRHLIEDLYMLSLSDAGGLRYNFAPLDLGSELNVAVDAIRPRAAEAGIEVRLETKGAVWVKGDGLRLAQLLGNLLENALAYTEAPGRIEIGLSANTGTAALVIEDTAPGVDEGTCERLFEPLYRPDSSRSRRKAGAGLGLAICRNIVDAHRGRITASPSALGGVRIRVELPVLESSEARGRLALAANAKP